MSSITNKQNTDASQANNISAVEETKTYYQKIADEYDAGKITDESIKAACEKQNPPVNPESILNYVHMTRLEREMSPYYKSDLSELKVNGTDYNGTLKDGETKKVAGCTITAKTYKGDDVKDTKNVFGLETLERKAKRDAVNSKDTWDYVKEFFGGKSKSSEVKESDWMPNERTLYHCSSPYLGEFDYDPTMYRIGYKEIEEKDGTKSQLPVLQYIGPDLSITGSVIMDNSQDMIESVNANRDLFVTANKICNNLVPKGCKVLDYTYAAGTSAQGAHGYMLEYLPMIPEGVESMNCSFKGCDGLEVFPAVAANGVYEYFGVGVNESRLCILPSTLECASSAFKDCSSLNGEFRARDEGWAKCSDYDSDLYTNEVIATLLAAEKDVSESDAKKAVDLPSNMSVKDQLPKGVVNTLDMFSGCQGLDKEYTDGYSSDFHFAFWSWSGKGSQEELYFDKAKFGGNLTPYLSPSLSRGIYDDIADSATLGRTDNATDTYFKDDNRITFIKDDGSVTSESDLDENKLNESRSAQIIISEGEVDSAHVDTSVEVASDDQRTNNKIKSEDGTYEYDSTGFKKSFQDEVKDTSALWEKMVILGGTGLSLFGAGTAITDNKLAGAAIGVGGTLLLDKVVDVLPNSLYPIVSKTASLFPGELGDTLQKWADKLPGAESYKLNEEIRKYNSELEGYNKQWDNDYNLGKANYKGRLSNLFESATTQARTSMLVDTECINYMKENAKACAKELSFAAVATLGENSAKCVYDVVEMTTNTAEKGFNDKFNGKTLTENDKTELREYYVLLMDSLKAYSDGGIEGINECDGMSNNKASLQKDGLAMVNRAYIDAAMTSLKEMNNKYNFMNEESWKHLEGLSIEGVDMSNIKNYSKTYFDEVKKQAAIKTNVDAQNLSKTDGKFKDSMKEELAKIEEEIDSNPDVYAQYKTSIAETKSDDEISKNRETIEIQESESDTSELTK